MPMGADLPPAPEGSGSPSFLVAALKDPLSGNLGRIQIVKGWVDAEAKCTRRSMTSFGLFAGNGR